MKFDIDWSALDQLNKAAEKFPDKVRSATKSAFKSAAFFLKNELKTAVAENKFGWPQHQEYTRPGSGGTGFDMTQVLRANRPVETAKTKAKGGGIKTAYIPAWRTIKKGPAPMLGKLRNVFRYLVGGATGNWLRTVAGIDEPYAIIGVLGKYASPKAEQIMTSLQQDGEIDAFERYGATDSESIRRFFGALGMPLKAGTPGEGFKYKGRPLFGPVLDEATEKVNAAIAEKIDQKIQGSWFEEFK